MLTSTPSDKDWKNLPKPLNCFTVRSASMVNLNTRKIVRSYAANTKIVVVQKCVMPEGTYYRTSEAEHYSLNYAFEASAFGLPNEKAPSVPIATKTSKKRTSTAKSKPLSRKKTEATKQKNTQKVVSPKDGGVRQPKSWWKKLFRRSNG